ncbi:V-type ATPase subunit [Sulfuracidifex metallicus]|uniref:ATPase n=1 Tax=Sulfuracidifex metallicus DSM 6482 = JCM 9184 TaxID=523847 RepID=A0A6A9QM95_SULME|nr:V-type ATPase subunit [Sulfuracidifex metallicus]MUN28311.1 ATPase [Sulfuracidifex metallicus DSM 6482 = JCM 9184]WOE51158.1 V-type ATPase subunit [Sulfuracidifex metallicus DSM 6482 = JCM 9184]
MSAVNAYLHSISRTVKTETLTRGDMGELMAEDDWRQVFNTLKEKEYIDEIPATLEEGERIIIDRQTRVMEKLMGYSYNSKISKDITSLYLYDMMLDEFKNIVTSVYNKRQLNGLKFHRELSKFNEGIPSSEEELRSAINGTIFGNAYNFASSYGYKNVTQLLSLLDLYFIYRISSIIETLRGDWKMAAKSIVCGYQDYYALSLATYQAMVTKNLCETNEELIKDLASTDYKGKTEVLRRFEPVKSISSKSAPEILSKILNRARKMARKNSLNVFMGQTFSPVIVMAASEMLRLDKGDILAIANGKKLKLSNSLIQELVSYDLV